MCGLLQDHEALPEGRAADADADAPPEAPPVAVPLEAAPDAAPPEAPADSLGVRGSEPDAETAGLGVTLALPLG